jgi:hypothetical protein
MRPDMAMRVPAAQVVDRRDRLNGVVRGGRRTRRRGCRGGQACHRQKADADRGGEERVAHPVLLVRPGMTLAAGEDAIGAGLPQPWGKR